MNPDLTPAAHTLTAADRRAHYGHDGAVLWLTGLSASGKSSLAMALEHALTKLGYSCYVLDGDNIRRGLNADLSFSSEDRAENIRRVGEAASLFADAGLICITAFISPYRDDRMRARQCCRQAFHEIYVAADLATCETRDPKGLYKRARAGDVQDFTGISAPYEAPEQPEYIVDSANETLSVSTEKLITYVVSALPIVAKH